MKFTRINLCKIFNLIEVGYAPYSSAQLSIDLADHDREMVEVRQGSLTLFEPSKQLEALIKDSPKWQHQRYTRYSHFKNR
ncbi:hypothetical protein C9J48_06475 [Photobacterium profundum]|nr:hypothetical protein C9J48_06475 [Photobacterium profundum]